MRNNHQFFEEELFKNLFICKIDLKKLSEKIEEKFFSC